ncbi:MAG TPA: choice-of-anchor E domain-containing protein [Nocardioides sp.]|nr:choice-of-anchor E domain-containing protein [Nocardioides sp.]
MAVLVGAAAMALPVVTAAPTNAAEIISSEGSVTVESYPSVKQVLLERFDDQDGRLQLTKVTVTGTVESELDGSLTNLSASREKTLTGAIASSIEVDGPGVEDLTAAGNRTSSWTLAAGETRQVQLAASGSSVETITEPELLDDFVGTGTLEYDVDSQVSVKIDGPAPYRTSGVAGGKATVRIDYTYDEVCVENPTSGSCGETPPESCPSPTDKIDPVAEGDYVLGNGGTFTITDIEDLGSGPVFDWTSTVPVLWVSVKGGPRAIDEQLYDYRPDGALAGEGLHAPLNPNSGKWYGLSHLTICAVDTAVCESDPSAPGCGVTDPCVVDPLSCEPPSSSRHASEPVPAAPVDREAPGEGNDEAGIATGDVGVAADEETPADPAEQDDAPPSSPQSDEEPAPDDAPTLSPTETPAGE